MSTVKRVSVLADDCNYTSTMGLKLSSNEPCRIMLCVVAMTSRLPRPAVMLRTPPCTSDNCTQTCMLKHYYSHYYNFPFSYSWPVFLGLIQVRLCHPKSLLKQNLWDCLARLSVAELTVSKTQSNIKQYPDQSHATCSFNCFIKK